MVEKAKISWQILDMCDPTGGRKNYSGREGQRNGTGKIVGVENADFIEYRLVWKMDLTRCTGNCCGGKGRNLRRKTAKVLRIFIVRKMDLTRCTGNCCGGKGNLRRKTAKVLRIFICWQRIFQDISQNSYRLRTRCVCLFLAVIVMKI